MTRLLRIPLLCTAAFSLSAFATQSDRQEDLKAVLRQQVRPCYALPRESRGAEPVVLEARLTSGGALEREAEVISGSPDSPVAKAALRALKKCTPFQIPPEWAPRYREWKVLRIQFKAD
jgi:colicin import membrane protein